MREQILLLAQARRRMGAKIYGDKDYLNPDRDLFKEGEEELLDFINYMTFKQERDGTDTAELVEDAITLLVKMYSKTPCN